MKIELTKETSVATHTGADKIYWWVRAWEGEDIIYRKDHVSKCFLDEEQAKNFYEGCKRHLEKYGTYAAHVEIVISETIETPIHEPAYLPDVARPFALMKLNDKLRLVSERTIFGLSIQTALHSRPFLRQ